jgi:hypothetical protein
MRDQRLGWDAILDQPFRRGSLHHFVRAGCASVFGAPRHNHFEPRRDHIEPLGHIFADEMFEAAAACTCLVRDVDHDLLARQVQWQRPTIECVGDCERACVLTPQIVRRQAERVPNHLMIPEAESIDIVARSIVT